MFRWIGWLRVLCILVLIVVAWSLFRAAPQEQAVALNTLVLGLCTSAVAIPLGILIAEICLNEGILPKLLWLTCLCLIFVPLFMLVSAWDSAFGKLGWLIDLTRSKQSFVSSWLPAIWIHSIAATPQVALIIWLGLSREGRTFEEQAALETDYSTVFWYVTIPRLMPLIGICFVWIVISCAREIAVTDIYRIGTFAEQIYLGYALGEFNQISGSPLLVPLKEKSLPFVSLTVGLFAMSIPTILGAAGRTSFSNDITQRSSTQASFWQSFGAATLLSGLLLVPAINLINRASRSAEFVDGTPVVRYSLANLSSVLSRIPEEFWIEFQWSFVIALVSSLVSVFVAVLLIWKARESKLCCGIVVVSIAICFSVPGPLIGSTLLQLRGEVDNEWVCWLFDRTILAPVLANMLFCWPIVAVLAWFAISNTAADALENSKLEGAESRTRLFRIVLAGNLPACIGFLLIVFAICFGELSASQLAIPPGIDTIPRRMLGMLHAGVDDMTAGLTIVSAAIIFAVCSAGWSLISLNRRWHRQ